VSLLETRGLTVRFGGNLAVSHVDLDVHAGVVHGLIGPNGAGKTTTFNMISGVQSPTAGHVRLDDRDVTRMNAHRRARLGIGRTFQRLEVFSSMTARENVLVGAEIRSGWARSDGRAQVLADRADLSLGDEVDLILDRVGLSAVADTRVGQLSTGQARLVELGRALAIRPRVLLLDEPASGLDDAETEAFGRLLIDLAGAGLAVLLVEHDVSLVMATCAHVTVLDYGQVIASGTGAQIRADRAVQAAYLGAEAAS